MYGFGENLFFWQRGKMTLVCKSRKKDSRCCLGIGWVMHLKKAPEGSRISTMGYISSSEYIFLHSARRIHQRISSGFG